MQTNDPVKPLPPIFISEAITQQRIARYAANKHPLLSNALVVGGNFKDDTKSIWYSKEHIETWLDEINYSNADGMRIYFGEYGQEDGAFAGQLCLIMVTTRLNTVTGGHEDIVLENEPDFADRLEVYEQNQSVSKDCSDNLESEKGYNYGAPCPPIC